MPAIDTEQSGLQLSPPFVLSVAVSPTGVLSASTASGLAFVGTGGEKRPTGQAQKKRKRKWGGLDQSEGRVTKVAEGPVVAMYVFLPLPWNIGYRDDAVHSWTTTNS